MLKNERGSVLISVLLVLLVLTTFVAVYGTQASLSIKEDARTNDENKAYYIARAGADAAAKWISDNASSVAYSDTSFDGNDIPFGDGTYKIKTTKVGNELTITSTGTYNKTKKDATLIMEIKEGLNISTSFKYAAYTSGNLTLTGSAEIKGDATSAGTVLLDKDKNTINGDLNLTSTGKVDNKSNGSANSIKTNVTVKPIFPDPNILMNSFADFPTEPNGLSSLSAKPVTSFVNNKYSSINVSSGTLAFDTQGQDRTIYVYGDMNISGGNLTVGGTGKLTIYVKGNVNIDDPNVNYVVDKQPNKLHIYCDGNSVDLKKTNICGYLYATKADINLSVGVTLIGHIITLGDNVTFSNKSCMTGAIYAPNANILLQNQGENEQENIDAAVKGAIIAKNIRMENKAKIIYDSTAVSSIVIPETVISGMTTTYGRKYWK